jgi:hypothetical protein
LELSEKVPLIQKLGDDNTPSFWSSSFVDYHSASTSTNWSTWVQKSKVFPFGFASNMSSCLILEYVNHSCPTLLRIEDFILSFIYLYQMRGMQGIESVKIVALFCSTFDKAAIFTLNIAKMATISI